MNTNAPESLSPVSSSRVKGSVFHAENGFLEMSITSPFLLRLSWLALTVGACFAVQPLYGQHAPAPSLFYSSGSDIVLAMQDMRVETPADGTYWCALQWNTGYLGLQQGGSGYTRHVHFSVWDPPVGDGQTTVVRLHPNTRGGRFGGEGTGVATYHPYPWKTNVTYAFAISVAPQPGGAEYKAFFHDPDMGYWRLLASIFRPGAVPQLAYASSFLEDFIGSTNVSRSGLYGNAWVKDSDGAWYNPTSLYFNASIPLPTQVNYDGDVVGDMFRLETGGNTVNDTPIQTWQMVASGARTLPEPSDAMPQLVAEPLAPGQVRLSWPLSDRAWLVQRSTNSTPPALWQTIPVSAATNNGRVAATLPVSNAPALFRLVDPTGDWSVAGMSNLVRNASFEEFASGFYASGEMGAWDLRVGSGSANAGVYGLNLYQGANVTHGSRAFDMGMAGYVFGNSQLQQLLPLTPGRHYQLSFDWGSEYHLGTTFQVAVGNLAVQLADIAGTSGSPWIQHASQYQFTAAGGDRLIFQQLSSDYWGLVLDNVRIVEIP